MTPRDVSYIVNALPMQAGLVPVSAPVPAPPPPPLPVMALENVPGTMVVGTQATAQVRNTSTVTGTWGIGVGTDLNVTPSTGTLGPGAVQPLTLDAIAANSFTLALTVAGGSATGTPATIVASLGAVAPVPNFIGAPAAGTVPFTTTFTNQSTGTYSALLWNFGDGSTSTSANPTKAYTVPGSYTVTLTLTWTGGTVTFTRTAYITASAAPSATGQQLSGSTTGTNNISTTLTVTLNGPVPAGGGTTTISASGATLSTSTLTWTFGGATSQTFTITRATAGSTTVSVTNSMGLSNGSALTYTSSAANSATPFRIERTGVRYANLKTAHDAAQDGDVIKVTAGTYTVDITGKSAGGLNTSENNGTNYGIYRASLTIEWETPGQMPVIDMSLWAADMAARGGDGSPFIMGSTCLNLTIRGIRVKGNTAPSQSTSGSGIRCQPG